MSAVSDYKSSPFDIYVQPPLTSNYTGTATPQGPGYTGTGLNGIPDYSLTSLCGVRWNTTDGRQVILVKNAGTAIANAGLLVQSPAEVTAFEKLAMTVPTATPATAGTYQVLVTNGATVLDVNQYQGGYLVTASGTGLGQTLQIASHQPAANGATFIVTLLDPIQVTLDATTTVSLVSNPYVNTVISAHSGLSGIPVGVSMYAISASTQPTYNGTSGALTAAGTPVYAFLAVHGAVGVLMDADASAVGYPVGISDLTDGAVGTATLTTQPEIGICMQTSTSAQYVPVYLML